MPFNGSGVFQRVRNWMADAAAGVKIRADYHDSEDDGFAAGLSNCITKDGQTIVTQNIPMNSKRITGLADPVNPQDAATKNSAASAINSMAVLKTGDVMTGPLSATQIHVNGDTSGGYYFGPGGTQYLRYESGNFNLAGGPLLTSNDIKSNGNLYANGGSVWLNSAATSGMRYDGTNTILNAGAGDIYFESGSNVIWGNLNSGGISTTGGNFTYVSSSGTVTAAGTVQGGTVTSTGQVLASGPIYGLGGSIISRGPSGGAAANFIFQDNSGTQKGYIQWDGASGLHIKNEAVPEPISLLYPGVVRLSRGMATYSPVGGYSGHYLSFQINVIPAANTPIEVWGSGIYMGNLTPTTSDYRIKKDVIDLPGMWDTVKALRPIQYTHTDFTLPSGASIAADGIERWGFLAHELQDTLIQYAATGVKDDPDTIQSPNPFTVIAAVTKALQEAMTRIETMQAQIAALESPART